MLNAFIRMRETAARLSALSACFLQNGFCLSEPAVAATLCGSQIDARWMKLPCARSAICWRAMSWASVCS